MVENMFRLTIDPLFQNLKCKNDGQMIANSTNYGNTV